MSKKVSGQMRVLDKSSINQGQFQPTSAGNSQGRGKLKGIVPDTKLQNQPNLKNDASQRGKRGFVDIDPKGTDLSIGSSFTEAVSFHSVGGMKLVSANIERIVAQVESKGRARKPEISRKGGKTKKPIDKPKRKGKKDSTGKAVPNKKGNKPPTKKSDVVKGNIKKMNKRPKKITKKQAGKPKKILKKPDERLASNAESYQ